MVCTITNGSGAKATETTSLAAPAAIAGFAAAAQAAGDPAQGRTLTQAWCTGCHTVEGGGSDPAPPLRAIADSPGRTRGYLYAWLSDPHPPMPQLTPGRQEIADIIAYLDTLRRD